jgi:hypothetical protein
VRVPVSDAVNRDICHLAYPPQENACLHVGISAASDEHGAPLVLVEHKPICGEKAQSEKAQSEEAQRGQSQCWMGATRTHKTRAGAKRTVEKPSEYALFLDQEYCIRVQIEFDVVGCRRHSYARHIAAYLITSWIPPPSKHRISHLGLQHPNWMSLVEQTALHKFGVDSGMMIWVAGFWYLIAP